ncbi:hypothetical protein ACHAP7_009126 [Fusarium lateritium]
MTTKGNRLLFIVFFATCVAAADDAEFAFNLLSDIAPILALFGDQFAKQFTSESHTWLDHLIFAMVPLGIITAITGAIRAQGMPLAKAFLGRARENRAQVEIELMSSTSVEVCEIFNGNSIVRAMGRSKIAQIFIFPERYRTIEMEYKPFDQGSTNNSQDDKPKDTSCGIHSLKSAYDVQMIDCTAIANISGLGVYRSKSFIFFQDRWQVTKKISQKWSHALYSAFNKRSQAGRLKVNDTEKGRQDIPVDSSPPPHKRKSNLPAGAREVFSNPPNIQLNTSSDHFNTRTMKKGHEILLVATVGILLQTGLIAIAAVTAYRVSPNSSSIMESSVYGFPCYVGGSLLLSLGTGLCSFIVEHTTDEYSWDVRNAQKDTAPRLLWLQQKQSVNDQSFNAYVISAGPKRRLITSSRRVVPEGQRESNKFKRSGEGFWEWLTVGTAVSAGLGFTAQFMGLRGLAFPCSIAQLGSICIMALLRAGIRRRLGRPIEHSIAFQWYEIDFLAAQIVLYGQLRTFDGKSLDIKRIPDPKDYFSWEINTPDPQSDGDRLLVPLEPKTATEQELVTRISSVANPRSEQSGNITADGSIKDIPTSQQLLRVRKRLADLTEWKTRSSASAVALVRSIQFVMDTFFPEPKDRSEPLIWTLHASFPKLSGRQDSIKFSISRKKPSNAWDLDTGLIDAAMSLWMARIDAKWSNTANRAADQDDRQDTSENRKQHASSSTNDWRFGKDEDTLRYRFYRIIGDNLEDGVLKRDVSWWADSLDTKESEPGQGMAEDDELIIGFNGIEKEGERSKYQESVSSEFGISAEAPLPVILAQHLFTSFMWTVAQHLPKDCLNSTADQAQKEVEVEGTQIFESWNFEQTWPRLRLRHRLLTELARKIETFGMGSTRDIFLCIIPALSYMRLLPNQVVLKLMPRVGPGRGWVETASCHEQLLYTIKKGKISVKDKLDMGIVVASMDFLYFAYEPYGEREEVPLNLLYRLSSIAGSLCSTRFVELMKQLIPVYRLRRRLPTFERIFKQYPYVEGINTYDNNCGESQELDQEFARNALGFTRLHLLVNVPGSVLTLEDYFFLGHLLETYDALGQRIPDLLCAYSRSPIHLAALEGMHGSLALMLDSLSDEKRKHVIQTGGIDGMTPVHLISECGNVSCLDLIAPKGDALPLLTKKDIWGRQALHIASRSGLQEICFKLLEMGARSDQLDGIGNSSVDYFLDCKKSSNSGESKVLYLEVNESKRFLKFAMKNPACLYSHGRTFLHSAVELAHLHSIKDLLDRKFDLDAPDDDGRTPLHYAILAGRVDVATALINGFDIVDHEKNGKRHVRANLMATDSKGTTALMFAARKNLYDVVQGLLARQGPSIIDHVDDDGKTALFHANGLEMVESLVSKGCNTVAMNKVGRTRLHLAIQQEESDIAKYLLELKGIGQIQRNPYDNEGDSLLVTACQHGLSDLVSRIYHFWNDVLNTGDKALDQSPLAWACENGYTSVVKELLTLKVDVNRRASKYHDITALHISVAWNRLDILSLLLDDKTIDLGQKHSSGNTALEMAIDQQRTSAARRILLYKRTSSTTRIKALEKLVPMFPRFASENTMSLVSDCLKSIKDKALLCKFLVWLVSYGSLLVEGEAEAAEETESDAQEIETIDPPIPETRHVKNPDEISADAKDNQAQSPLTVFLAPLVALLIDRKWDLIDNPYDLVKLLGGDEVRKTLRIQQINANRHDNDMWSCVDYIERFDRKGVMKPLVARLRQSEEAPRPNYMEPVALTAIQYNGSINLHPCNVHGRICIGFCGAGTSNDEPPGWFPHSWAYHGDDGYLCIEDRSGTVPSDEFGDSGTFGTGDTVGVGLNMRTGQGFCTLNGKRLDMGENLQDEKL